MAEEKRYVVAIGINYTTPKGEVRAEPGAVVDDLPARAVRGLLDAKAIVEEREPKAKAKKAKDPQPIEDDE